MTALAAEVAALFEGLLWVSFALFWTWIIVGVDWAQWDGEDV